MGLYGAGSLWRRRPPEHLRLVPPPALPREPRQPLRPLPRMRNAESLDDPLIAPSCCSPKSCVGFSELAMGLGRKRASLAAHWFPCCPPTSLRRSDIVREVAGLWAIGRDRFDICEAAFHL